MQVSETTSHAFEMQSRSNRHFLPSAHAAQDPPQSWSVHDPARHSCDGEHDSPLAQSASSKHSTHSPAPSQSLPFGALAQGVRARRTSVPGVPALLHVPARHGFAGIATLS
jgi:hypothetical protein